MKAFLIDPVARTITEVEHDNTGERGGLDDIYKQLECTTIDAIRLTNGDAIYVDDEGLMKPNCYWAIGGNVYAGRGLVLGTDANGFTTEPRITLRKVREMVSFGISFS